MRIKYVYFSAVFLLVFIPFLYPLVVEGRLKEKDYQFEWCLKKKGIVEYRLQDRSRVDCLLDDYAIEFDFAKSTKVMEGLGQALYYGMKTGKKPGLIIIIERVKDIKHYNKVREIIKHYKLNVHLSFVSKNQKVLEKMKSIIVGKY